MQDMNPLCPDKHKVYECIQHHCIQFPDVLCCSIRVKGKWEDYSRDQFWDLVCRYASLFSLALPNSSLILFIKTLDIHLLAAYVGAMKAGLLPAQISPPTAKINETEYRRKINHIHEITRFGAVFTDEGNRVVYTEAVGAVVFSPDMLGQTAEDHAPVQTDDALAQFSSGSTGMQKGVVLSHHAIISHTRSYAATLKLNSDDRIVTWLPLYHDMGLIACYLMPLMCGVPFYQMDPFDWIIQPDILLSAIEEKKATLCFLPNFAYQVLVNSGRPHNLGSMRLWINCSEPARLRSHEAFLRKYPSVRPETLTVCYALAENTFAVSQTLPWHLNSTRVDTDRGVLSCGRPIQGVAVKIFDTEGHKDGEIGIRSGSLFNYFLDGTQSLQDGFYLTGDLGYVDAQGELFVTGRKKDIIIVCGKNVYPQDVEYVASAVDGVYPGRVVAFGIWNEEMGSEDLIVLIERVHEFAPTSLKIAVQKAVQDEVGIVPKRVEILEHMSLVKTSSGKISRSRNREIYKAKGFKVS